MREILFRGKRTDNGEWVEGLLITVELDTYSEVEKAKYTHCIVEPKAEMYRGDLCGFEFVKPETVGQYTGLEDRNGKKIFEGDILKNEAGYVYSGEYKTEVAYDLGEFCGLGFCNIEPCDFKYCEVIGNIHDNPELLN